MKLLIHNEERDTTPEAVKIFGDISKTLILTEEDINVDSINIYHTRGYSITTLLIPKLFEKKEKKDILEKTNIWMNLIPSLGYGNKRWVKIIYY